MHDILSSRSIPSHAYLGVVTNAYNPSPREVEAEGSEAQGHRWLLTELGASLS